MTLTIKHAVKVKGPSMKITNGAAEFFFTCPSFQKYPLPVFEGMTVELDTIECKSWDNQVAQVKPVGAQKITLHSKVSLWEFIETLVKTYGFAPSSIAPTDDQLTMFHKMLNQGTFPEAEEQPQKVENQELNIQAGLSADLEVALALVRDLTYELRYMCEQQYSQVPAVLKKLIELGSQVGLNGRDALYPYSQQAYVLKGDKLTVCLKKPTTAQKQGKKVLPARVILPPNSAGWPSLMTNDNF